MIAHKPTKQTIMSSTFWHQELWHKVYLLEEAGFHRGQVVGRPSIEGRQSTQMALGSFHEQNCQESADLAFLIFCVGNCYSVRAIHTGGVGGNLGGCGNF